MTGKPDKTAQNVVILLAVAAAVAVAIVAVLSVDPTGQRGAGTGQDYDLDLRELRRIDPSRIKWQASAPAIPTGMDLPIGLAVLGDNSICVVGDRALAVFAPDGQRKVRVELEFAPLAVAAKDRTIYAASKNAIAVFSSDGGKQAVWAPLDDKAHLTSVAISDDYVYAADAGNRVVIRYDRKTGKRTYRKGRPESGAFLDGFSVPSPHMDVAMAPNGDLLTVDPGRSVVQVRGGFGDVLKKWGARGSEISKFYGCCNPAAIAVLSDGRVVTYEKILRRVKIYEPQGKLHSVVAGSDRFSEPPKDAQIVPDIAVDSKGRVLVLDPTAREIRIYTPKPKRRSYKTTGASQ